MGLPDTFLADVRTDLVSVLTAVVPADVTVFATPPDDVLDVPAVMVDMLTCSAGFDVPSSTVVRAPVIVAAHRTDTSSSIDLLDQLTAVVWNALGGGTATHLPTTSGQCRPQSAEVSNLAVGDTTWPTITVNSDVTVMSGYC
jgi:hypothetical protein